MTLLLVLNELSYPVEESPSPADADLTTAVGEFASLMVAVRKDHPGVALVAAEPVPALLTRVAPSWQADARNRDKRLMLLQLASKSPISSKGLAQRMGELQYDYRGSPAWGLGGAHLVDGLAVSLPTAARWSAAALTLDRHVAVEDDDGDVVIVADEVEVRHANHASHVEQHRSWLARRGLRDVHTGPQLRAESSHLFPFLRFLPQVHEALDRLEPRYLDSVKKLLLGFQEAVRDWDASDMTGPQWPVKVTPEHQQRKEECWFDDPVTGRREKFDQHARFTPGEGRMHFRWDAQARQVVIAHLGRKLGI
jgi:hypothetical protein